MKMRPQKEYTRLFRLLDDSLRSFSDIDANCFTDELEKELLISLSKVIVQVRHWTQEFDFEEELLAESGDMMGECSVAATISYLDNSHSLAKIIGDLISLLACSSRYTQHLVGNTLVAISEFVVACESGWDVFMNFLCLCLELAICNTLSPSSVPDALEARYSYYDLPASKVFVMQKLKNSNWFIVAGIVRVVRGILKNLKQYGDEKIMKVYLDSVSSLILNVPWGLLGEIHVDHDIEVIKNSVRDVSLQIKVVQLREITVFLGHFIQFLCSVVEQSSSVESGVGFSPMSCKITSLIPILVAWFNTELQSPLQVCNFHYFRHKVLIVMIKVSSHIHIEDKIILSWLSLLHQYFEDLLSQPITKVTTEHESSLEGLPFCRSSMDQGSKNIPSRHLLRLTVFLFLRCSLCLINVQMCSDTQCSSNHLKRDFNFNQKFDSQCCNKSKGLTELHKWLQAQVHPAMIVNHALYFQQCLRFTSSFLQLFMHEDDILFDMLLQLFCVPVYVGRHNFGGMLVSDVQNEQVFLAYDLFNPINLFHLFLAEISYDHQVLLDYLISNDMGSKCAEYLLRSLRHICNLWNLFVEFPGVEEGLTQLHSYNEGISSLEMGHNYRLPFVAARDCLVSLRASIDSLNKKNLFPYNPQVLLRRLTRFKELCMKEKI